ncbi:MAG: CHAT domain-containing protein [Hyphomicrobiaceae bacterium]|nr:CHAT domain-containing protein [Hyphomicrobiaceae bacterium]
MRTITVSGVASMSAEADAAYEELKRLNQMPPDHDVAELGIEVARRVLALIPKSENPGRWASAQGELSRYCCILGAMREDAALIESGVEAARQKASALPPDEDVRFWLSSQQNLAEAYRTLAEVTEDVSAVRSAIEILEATLAQWPTSENADEPMAGADMRPLIHNSLGGAYQELSSLLGDDTGLRESVRQFGLARLYWTKEEFPEDWAMATYNESVTLKTLAYLSGEADVLEQAIAGLRTTIEMLSPEDDADWWATRMDGLANALLELGGLRADAKLREEALDCYRRALEVVSIDLSPGNWARIQANYTGALVDVARERHDPTSFLSAIEAADAGLERATETEMPRHWTALNLNRADAVRDLALLTGGEDLLEDVRQRLAYVLERTRDGDAPASLAHVLRYAAAAELRVGIRRRSIETIDQAIAKFEEALKLSNRETAAYVWASIANETADTYRHRAQLACDPRAFDRAAELLNATIDIYHDRRHAHAEALVRLERGELALSRHTLLEATRGSPDLLACADADFSAACDSLPADLDPRRHVRARRGLLLTALARGALEDVQRIGSALLADAEALLVTEAADHGRSALLDLLTGVGEATALAACERGDFEAALGAIERGRAFALRTRLRHSELALAPEAAAALDTSRRELAAARKAYANALSEPNATSARLGNLKARMEDRHRHLTALMHGTELGQPAAPPTLADLRAALATGHAAALVVLMAAPAGGGALIVTGDTTTFSPLPRLSTRAIDNWLRGTSGTGWLDSYDAFRSDLLSSGGFGTVHGISQWNATIVQFLETLADTVTTPLGRALAEAGVDQDDEVAIVAPGRLSALPLHAAGRRQDGHWRTFMDDHPLRYVPSLGAFASLTRRAAAAEKQPKTLIAVTDPEGDLGVVTNPAMPQFEDRDAHDLRGSAATRDAVLTALPKARYASFFAHAWWEPARPESSHIRLAGGDRLAVADFEDIDLSGLRLVTLGACESGMPGLDQAPDEFQGLPNALIGAGVAAVAATLWPVFNQATAEALATFYDGHINRGASPARAMRDAQRAVRDLGQARHLEPTRSVSGDHLPRAAVQAPQDSGTQAATERALGIRRKAAAPQAMNSAEASSTEAETHIRFDWSQPLFWAGFCVTGA